MIGGDRANANPLDGDGNDSIHAMLMSSGNTIYGGGGNDTVTSDMTASTITLGAGADVYPQTAALMMLLLKSKTPRLVLVPVTI